MTDRLLTPEQVAEHLGMATQTLAQWRWLKKGPTFKKISNRVRYPADALERWLSDQQESGESLSDSDSPDATTSSRAQ